MAILANIKKTRLIIVAGASGSGKTYLINKLSNDTPYYSVVKKYTTRSPRKSENPESNLEFIFNSMRSDVENCDCYYSFRSELYGFNYCDIEVALSKKNAPL